MIRANSINTGGKNDYGLSHQHRVSTPISQTQRCYTKSNNKYKPYKFTEAKVVSIFTANESYFTRK